MVSGFFLHIKCGGGGGRRVVGKSRQPEAARGSWAPARRPTEAPQDARPSGPQRILARLLVPLAKVPKRTRGFPEVEKEKHSRSGVRSPGSVAPAAEKFCHGQSRSDVPQHRRIERNASCATSQPRPPAGPTPRGGARQGSFASSQPPG